MKLTTHFTLHSQVTRLFERTSYAAKLRIEDGILTLYDALFQKTYIRVTR